MTSYKLDPIQTTFQNMKCQFINLLFHENDLIKILEPNEFISRISCNPKIDKYHESYIDNSKPVNPRVIKKPHTKHHGNYFNSQITFHCRYSCQGLPKYLKIKVFRNGKIQIPGMNINIDLIKHLTDIQNILFIATREKYELGELQKIVSNYRTKLDANVIINLHELYKVFRNLNYIPIFNPEIFNGLRIDYHGSTIIIFNSSKINFMVKCDIPDEPTLSNIYKFLTDTFNNIDNEKFIYRITI
jgi:TATA-box binding protein (TBP) (component of TFIID and TFIIIB)